LEAALGPRFVLDLVTMVTVPPGASAQDPHRDLPDAGSIGTHIPLHALTEDMAPLGICGGTHVLPREDAAIVTREALLWRPQNESTSETKIRLLCGGRERTDSVDVSCKASVCRSVKLRDSRLGASIFRFTHADAETLPWRIGDAITHANGHKIKNSDDWDDILAEAKDEPVVVHIERAREGPAPPASRLIVGAPLNLGDAILYDSRTWHWGMTNLANHTRYVLYVNFKINAEHEGVHPEAKGSQDFQTARKGFQDRLLRLQQEWMEKKEL